MGLKPQLLTYPFSGRELVTRSAVAATAVLITCSLVLALYVYEHTGKMIGKEMAEYQAWEYDDAVNVQRLVERRLEKIQHELLFTSRLPGLRAMQGMDREALAALAAISANLFDGRVVADVTFAPARFESARSPSPGTPQALLTLYNSNKTYIPDTLERTYKTRLMLDHIAWFKANVPTLGAYNAKTASGHFLFNLYDTTQKPSDTAEHHKLLFSVPAYDTKGLFKGIISASIPAVALRDMLPKEDYALAGESSREMVLPAHLSDSMKDSLYFIGQGARNPRLTYSAVLPIALDGYESTWKLWTGVNDAAFVDSSAMQLALYRNTVGGMTLIIALSSLLSIGILYRNHLSVTRAALAARDKAEAQHKEKSNLLAGVIDYTVDGLITIDGSGLIEIFNPACERLFGYTKEEVTGRNIKILMPEPHQGRHDGYITDYKQTGQARIIGKTRQVEALRKDGTTFPLELAVAHINLGSRQIFCGIMRDITDRVATEQKILSYAAQVKDKNLDMATAKEHAEEANRLKSEFIANVSHEIRSNMSGIIGMGNLLLGAQLKAPESGYAQTIKQSAESLLQIVSDILDLSKIESGRIVLEPAAFDLRQLCEELFSMVSFKANYKHIELLMRYPKDIPRRVVGDSGRLRQILLNLLNNAIKFTEKGHVLLCVSCKSRINNKLVLHIEVEDTGIGIPPERMDFVFDSFNQVGNQGSHERGGGLGLSICRELCRIMGGHIGVRSEFGAGSTFWFNIAVEEEKASVDVLSQTPRESLLKGMRVLMVDDHEMTRTLISDQLTACGMKVTCAMSGEQALRMLDEGMHFDAAIIDSMLPGMDGVMFSRTLKEKHYADTMALLVVTSSPGGSDMKTMEEIGCAGYFTKPVTEAQWREAFCLIAEARGSGKAAPFITQHSIVMARENQRVRPNRNLRFVGAHILLAEDNAMSQMLTIAVLKKYGCHVTVAGNGDEAVRLLSQSNVDMVFMDCQMPVMDGFETTLLIRKLEAHQVRRRIPIIALTADNMKGVSKQCFSVGMNDYITKPIRQEDIERMLLKWVPDEKHIHSAPEEKGETENLDGKVFSAFRTLMGESSTEILTRYIATSRECLETIENTFADNNYPAMRTAAHSLEAASKQIGAVKLAGIAAGIEGAGTVEPAMLQELINQLVAARMATEMSIGQKLNA